MFIWLTSPITGQVLVNLNLVTAITIADDSEILKKE